MQEKLTSGEVLATVTPSVARRVLGIGLLCVLAAMVISVAVSTPPSLGWQVFLVAMGAICLMTANEMRKSTGQTLELTGDELRDTSGNVLARMEDVVSIDRGAFAFKPSNGFVLRLGKPYARAWHPGLWWRAGKRVGVGGMTSGRETKFMADLIAVMIAEREKS
jgi:hypothetical protein